MDGWMMGQGEELVGRAGTYNPMGSLYLRIPRTRLLVDSMFCCCKVIC